MVPALLLKLHPTFGPPHNFISKFKFPRQARAARQIRVTIELGASKERWCACHLLSSSESSRLHSGASKWRYWGFSFKSTVTCHAPLCWGGILVAVTRHPRLCRASKPSRRLQTAWKLQKDESFRENVEIFGGGTQKFGWCRNVELVNQVTRHPPVDLNEKPQYRFTFNPKLGLP
jgi:hypothetical protein